MDGAIVNNFQNDQLHQIELWVRRLALVLKGELWVRRLALVEGRAVGEAASTSPEGQYAHGAAAWTAGAGQPQMCTMQHSSLNFMNHLTDLCTTSSQMYK